MLTIISNGTPAGTHVYDEKGEEIHQIISMTVQFEPFVAPVATLKFYVREIEILADEAQDAGSAQVCSGVSES